MKFSLHWLNEWVSLPKDYDSFLSGLPLFGFEMDEINELDPLGANIVVGQIIEKEVIEKQKYYGYVVKVARNKKIKVVSTEDFKVDAKLAVAKKGAKIANYKVEPRKIAGVVSEGIFCSEKDLVLSNEIKVVAFGSDVEAGTNVSTLLNVDDTIIDVDVLPNRSDCLSVSGFAKELSVILSKTIRTPVKSRKIKSEHSQKFKIKLIDGKACPIFCSCIITDVKHDIETPIWLKERLLRSGLRSISPVVDITNYVMLEMGQPMHAYDLDKLSGSINVRFSKKGEKLLHLDNDTIKLDDRSLVIADDSGPIALAGIIGGLETSVDENTTNILLESAYFEPTSIVGRARKYNLTTDSSYRFERGVNPENQLKAVERAAILVKDILGGKIGPCQETTSKKHLPSKKVIKFKCSSSEELLGIHISEKIIKGILERIGCNIVTRKSFWQISAPFNRFDLNIEADLIEEVARIYGYDKIKPKKALVEMGAGNLNHKVRTKHILANLLKDRGYHECITYSFVDPKIQSKMFPTKKTIKLMNPISPELSEMRLSMWPGLIQALQNNLRRQQNRVRLFESGLCYFPGKQIKQIPKLGGIITGSSYEEQWGINNRNVDFYDVKKDLECLFKSFLSLEEVNFVKSDNPILCPGQRATIFIKKQKVGELGLLHPTFVKEFDLESPVILFELDLAIWPEQKVTIYQDLSKYPALRRDLSFYVKKDIEAQELTSLIKSVPNDFLQDVSIFDIYDQGTEKNEKSVAISLILQHFSRTLKEETIIDYIANVIDILEKNYQIRLRDK